MRLYPCPSLITFALVHWRSNTTYDTNNGDTRTHDIFAYQVIDFPSFKFDHVFRLYIFITQIDTVVHPETEKFQFKVSRVMSQVELLDLMKTVRRSDHMAICQQQLVTLFELQSCCFPNCIIV